MRALLTCLSVVCLLPLRCLLRQQRKYQKRTKTGSRCSRTNHGHWKLGHQERPVRSRLLLFKVRTMLLSAEFICAFLSGPISRVCARHAHCSLPFSLFSFPSPPPPRALYRHRTDRSSAAEKDQRSKREMVRMPIRSFFPPRLHTAIAFALALVFAFTFVLTAFPNPPSFHLLPTGSKKASFSSFLQNQEPERPKFPVLQAHQQALQGLWDHQLLRVVERGKGGKEWTEDIPHHPHSRGDNAFDLANLYSITARFSLHTERAHRAGNYHPSCSLHVGIACVCCTFGTLRCSQTRGAGKDGD